MLNFFKKPPLQNDEISSTVSSPTHTPDITQLERKCMLKETKTSSLISSFEDEGLFDIGEFESTKERSRLSKTLNEVLNDKAALGYFIQFLESRNALPYIRCWLDIENFHNALQQYKDDRSSLTTKVVEHDSLSVSTDCDSYTGDSTSLYDYSSPIDNKTKIDMESEMNNDDDVIIAQQTKCMQEFTDDALRMFKKYIALEADENVNCKEEMRNEIIENICNMEKLLTTNCFKPAQAHVYAILEKDFFDAFLSSDYFCKLQIDVLTSGNVALDDILYNETALFYFMEFLEQENNRNLLEFWLAASNFHQQLHNQKDFFDPIEAQADAVILYDKYFSLQALCPLGFGDRVRFAVEQNICGENGLMLDCFHLPMKIIEQILERYYLKAFLASQLFYKYLSELINAVQSTGYAIYDKTKHLSSDCSSEKSFSTHNSTFLAMENPNHNNNNNHRWRKDTKATTDMNIDTRELYDPDALWKRKKYHRLSFGRVTELGKFITDTEPEPDKKISSKFRHYVRRFVHSDDEHKRKEELAWQVAEMIVKDITSITLSEQKT